MELLSELQEAMRAQTVELQLSPDAAHRALRGARRRQRQRLAVAASAALAVAAAVAVGSDAAAGGGLRDQVRAVGPADGGQSSAPSAQQLHDAVIAALFPATGADFTFDATHGLRAFSQSVFQHDVAACMAQKDAPYMPDLTAPVVHVNDFPDLSVLSEQGLSGPAEPGVSADSPLGQCNASVARSADAQRWETTLRGPLPEEWMQTATAVDHDPRVLTAYQAFGPCAAAHGVAAASESDFFGYADGSEQSAATEAQRRAIDVHLGRIYATCMQPIEAVRSHIRTGLRGTFLDQHQADVQRIEQQVAMSVAALEQKTGVAWPS